MHRYIVQTSCLYRPHAHGIYAKTLTCTVLGACTCRAACACVVTSCHVRRAIVITALVASTAANLILLGRPRSRRIARRPWSSRCVMGRTQECREPWMWSGVGWKVRFDHQSLRDFLSRSSSHHVPFTHTKLGTSKGPRDRPDRLGCSIIALRPVMLPSLCSAAPWMWPSASRRRSLRCPTRLGINTRDG